MDRADLVNLITASFRDHLQPPEAAGAMTETTYIFGRGGFLDSMQLVNLLIDVEQQVNEQCGTTISIADDRAMSQERSPFRTIGNLADYVALLLAEQKPSS